MRSAEYGSTIRGVIFDLDGTLVDSGLDFEQMRREMGLPSGMPILEGIKVLPNAEAEHCRRILHEHEWAGCERGTLLPGVAEFLAVLTERELPVGIVTRNSRDVSLATLRRLKVHYDVLLTRDDGPIKPDPWPVRAICQRWQVPPEQVVMIGDFRFDVQSGRAAGTRTVLLSGVDPSDYPNDEGADLVLSSLVQWRELLAWLES
ncbi:MAG TPA: HAD family hydrolase [Pirellulaceae bacterium]|nr:HAD family hydrolase [Pirellulaceae bacterium]